MSRMGKKFGASRLAVALLGGTMLAGLPALASAQEVPAPATGGAAEAAPEPAVPTIRTISVVGNQRLEPETILSYIQLREGQEYTQARGDQALKDLYATELFADVSVRENDGAVVIEVRENPVINRIILEGNKRIKDDKILPEIKLAARQIFTRSKVRADVARIIELYKRKGRYAAKVEPKMVELEQNRVDIVFEISEGGKSKVRQINIIGNEKFSDGDLRDEMITKQARFFRMFSSSTGYDPDRMAYDQQKMRQFYLTEGYADFRVVSAVAELTPDKEDFIITYVVEEGERYKFGDVVVESQLRDFDGQRLTEKLPMEKGQWYNAKEVEDTVEGLSEAAGALGYAFGDVRPQFRRNKDDLTMSVTFQVAEAPRVYVEQIDVNGNTLTQDKVIRREFRIGEGDAFNSQQVKRSENRIKSLGYFQEKFEVQQEQGSAPDRIVLQANVEEKPTGELQLSAGFSSLESFILQGSVRQNNFRGRGQTVGASVSYSRYTRSVQLSFTEPYVFDRNISAGIDIYRRDLNSFNYFRSSRNTTYERGTTGISLRVGVPMTEYITAVARYTLNYDDVSLGNEFFSDRQNPPNLECDPLLAGNYLCDALGKDLSSIFGLSLIYDDRDSRIRPTRGQSATINIDVAAPPGDVSYARLRADASKHWKVLGDFIFSISAEGGVIKGFKSRGGAFVDDVRLTDRFFLGEPQLRGFDIRGVGPRVLRYPYLTVKDENGVDQLVLDKTRRSSTDDALGGKYYYQGRAELEIPLGSGARELGLRPSIFLDAGAVWGLTKPDTIDSKTPINIFAFDDQGNQLYTQIDAAQIQQVDGQDVCVATATSAVTDPVNAAPPACFNAASLDNSPIIRRTVQPFSEFYLGDTWKPRVAVGIGVNWNSPFGPLQLNFSRVLLKQEGDDTKLFSFNVGTQF
ncbi:MAG: outer membrane protein assembly factor BamA [Novosphingobium sp.]|nr:outer membrane protein assembly factor BamA [Novosphingobium sp.]MCP5388730.1 outer membrane protein assembly factor BamA [Novosphingobium sp.]